MPRVKIDYVLSFSSEDPDNQANNLLEWDVSKKKWLCNKGEASCSVVLQLVKAVQISSVQIGVHHAALIEVLVGRSEKPNDPYKVLVASSVLVTPQQSRRDEPVERVRSFGADQLASDTANQKWDRVRVVCSQPYNKHCKYGISFIHIFEPDSSEIKAPMTAVTSAIPSRLFNIEATSSDDEDFKPGELFANCSQGSNNELKTNTSTEAQIRQASSQALRSISDTSTKLTKTPITKTKKNHDAPTSEHTDRHRNSLLYTDDDEKPHAKIDRIVDRHKDEKSNVKAQKEKDKLDSTVEESSKKDRDKGDKVSDRIVKNNTKHGKLSMDNNNKLDKLNEEKNKTPKADKTQLETRNREEQSSLKKNEKDSKKRRRNEDDKEKKELRAGPVSEPHTLLRDVVFAISGYVNPERANVRDRAAALGASFRRDWTHDCTHLICAFPNTPKLRSVRASGTRCVAVTADWVLQCGIARRRLPWQWFATEPQHAVQPHYDYTNDSPQHSDCDTDDEIEKVVRKQKRRRSGSHEGSAGGRGCGHDDSVTFVRDERMQGHVSVRDSDSEHTDTEEQHSNKERVDDTACLPDLFEGLSFVIDDDCDLDVGLLTRYVRAYGGLVIQEDQLDNESVLDYVLCTKNRKHAYGGVNVRADWVWKCHHTKSLYPIDNYTYHCGD